VRPFPSGKTALKYLESNNADLILLDYYMPEMTGLDVLQTLQSDDAFKDIPVIFLTGSDDESDEVGVLEQGAADYLKKPFKAPALRTRVRLQLELFRHRHHLEDLVAEQTAEIHKVNHKLAQRDHITLDLLAKASDMRDHDTGAHIERTTAYSRILVNDLLSCPKAGYELTAQQGEDIVEALKLHDLGKIAMPDNVLLKPERLTEEEFAIIRTHPTHGYEMLKNAIQKMSEDSLLLTACDITYGHHEKWNGKGYPRELAGTEIPIAARIAAIADVYDALTSKRPYKDPFSPEQSFAMMEKESGTHFDPYLIEVMLKHRDEFTHIALTQQDEGPTNLI
jgi:putative two-component system response regulator